MSHIEQLDVKSESVDPRSLQDRAASSHAESLESALRIREWKAGDHSQHTVEDTAAQLAQPRLTDFDEGSIERTRSKCKIAVPVLDWPQELWKFRDGGGQVSVCEDCDRRTCGKQAEAHRVSFAAIDATTDDACPLDSLGAERVRGNAVRLVR
jgi:hypothetical protein